MMQQDPMMGGPPQDGPPQGGLPPELLALLQGGGAPPQGPPQGGLPPELQAALSGGGLPGGPAPEQPPEMDPVEHLRQAIQHAQAALVAEPDDQDSQALAKVVQGLYAILANRQKEQEQLLGGGNLRGLARAHGQAA